MVYGTDARPLGNALISLTPLRNSVDGQLVHVSVDRLDQLARYLDAFDQFAEIDALQRCAWMRYFLGHCGGECLHHSIKRRFLRRGSAAFRFVGDEVCPTGGFGTRGSRLPAILAARSGY
jgi:hypothetical protein